MRTISAKVRVNPTIGDETSGTITLLTTPSTLIVSNPPATTEAPSSPPISAWLDELGMPRRQVTRFQKIAPTRAPATTIWLGSTPVPAVGSGVTSPDAIVLATAVPASAPTKFAVADRAIAYSGLRARVETEVAIALAVSWKPLM